MTYTVTVADPTGFCFGVRRAVDAALAAGRDGCARTLGPLIHNRSEVERLARAGVTAVDSLDDVPPRGTIVIRAHGAPPEVMLEAGRRGIHVLDLTCPFVKVLQRRAMDLAGRGLKVVVVGDPGHPEVRAVMGWAGGGAVVVRDESEAARLDGGGSLGIVFQTTLRREMAQGVVEVLRTRAGDVVVEDTICDATSARQEAARQLARGSDVMIAVGGQNSSNTLKLVEVCREEGSRTYHVEDAGDIDPQWLGAAAAVGVVAGASTPDWILKEVVQVLEDKRERPEETPPGEPQDDTECPAQEEETQAEESLAREEEQQTEDCPVMEEEEQAEDCPAPGEDEEAAPDEPVAADAEGREETEQEMLLQQEEALDFAILRPGDLLEGTVVQINDEGALVDVNYKSEGLIPVSELRLAPGQGVEDVLSVGDKLDVVVLSVDGRDGGVLLSQRRAAQELAWEALKDAYHEARILEAPVEEEVKGGLVLNVGVRGFMPASHVARGFERDLGKYVGEKMRVRVIEIDRHKNRVILSRKAVLEEEYQRQRDEILGDLAEGEVRTGVVKGVTEFGAFVDLGGVDGLLHVSEMSWGRIDHPSSVVKEGEELEVKVLRVDRDSGKISLGLKQLLPDPWVTLERKYPVGSIVNGKIMRLAPFGAFVQLEPGVEGLVHISQLSDRHVEHPSEAVSEGDEVMVRVLKVQPKERRISLSIRDAQREVQTYSDAGNVTLGDVFGDLLQETRSRLTQGRKKDEEAGSEDEDKDG